MPTVYDRSHDRSQHDRPQYDRPQLDDPLMDERPQELTGETAPSPPEQLHQKHLMVSALGLLFVALLVVTGRNWDFWSVYFFPQTAESDSAAGGGDGVATQAPSLTASKKPGGTLRKPRVPAKAAAIPVPADAQPGASVMTQRTVLPPLEIEVVSGNQHSKLQPKTNTLHVDVDASAPSQPAAPGSGAVTQAADRAPIAAGSDVVSHEVEPSYPFLARQMKVQGSVVLRALIAKSGDIQDLQVLRGPTVLSEAARDAVKQWRFKPYYQGGQAVETEAQIKVNFTISAY